ncbi:MAG TPA: MipA/OmpV family protein [Burkholderiales bacterium]|nr:MipA/OmpV family protein [Burkholderiales bacterium]
MTRGMRALAFLFLFPAAAFAQDLGTLLGAGVRSRPEYDGASKQELEPIPVVRYYGRTLFARTTQGILEGGARVEVTRGLVAGAQLAYEGGNDRTDVDPGASYGLHLEWDTRVGPAPVNVLARTRMHFDSDLGRQTDLRATVGVYGSGGLLAYVFAQATWASDEWVRSYYTAGGGGLLFTAAGIEGAYELSRHWVLVASLSARRLHGDAASSPITEDKTNYYASAGLAYRF